MMYFINVIKFLNINLMVKVNMVLEKWLILSIKNFGIL